MWDDDLCVAFGAKSTRLQQRLEEENAALIHVQTSFDIVQRIGDTINIGEEFVVVEI